MSARRALLEPVEDTSLEQAPGSARRALTLELIQDELRSVSALSAATRGAAPQIGFEPDEAAVVVLQGATPVPRGLRRSPVRLRKTMLGVATLATASAVLVVPNLVNNVSAAQDRISHTIPVNGSDLVSRDSERSALDSAVAQDAQRAEERARMAEARAAKAAEEQVRADAQAQLAEQARAAEEARKAEESRIAEERAAAEEARQAEERAAQQAAAATQANNQPSSSPSAQPAPQTPPPSSGSASGAAQGAVAFALSQVGMPYVWGSTGPGGYDCSGLMVASYASVGISLPRTSYDMASVGYAVSYGDLQPGDLIISYGGGHVSMYIGNGMIVHAQDSSTGVITSPLSSQSIVAIRRVA